MALSDMRLPRVFASKRVSTVHPTDLDQNVVTEFTWDVHSMENQFEETAAGRRLCSNNFKLKGVPTEDIHASIVVRHKMTSVLGQDGFEIELLGPRGCDTDIEATITFGAETHSVSVHTPTPNFGLTVMLFKFPRNSHLETTLFEADSFSLKSQFRITQFRGKRVDTDIACGAEAGVTLADCLGDAFEAGRLSDVKLKSEDGQEFSAHRTFLALRSPVFEAMFYGSMREAHSGVASIKASGRAIRELLRCVYTDVINNDEAVISSVAEELLDLGAQYEMAQLTAATERVLHRNLGVENAARCFGLSSRFRLEELRNDAKTLIRSNLAAVMKTDGWSDVFSDPSAMAELMKEERPSSSRWIASPPKLKRPRRQ